MTGSGAAAMLGNDVRARGHAAYWAFIVLRLSGLALTAFLPVHFWALHALIGYSDRPPGVQVLAFLATLAALVTLSRLVGQGPRLHPRQPGPAKHAH